MDKSGSILRFIFLAVLLWAALPVMVAQDLGKRIAINTQEKPLGEVLSEISRKGGIHFSYNPQVIPIDQRVSIRAGNKTIRSILDELLPPIGVSYIISENQVVLKIQGLKPTPSNTAGQGLKKFTISGFVRDKSTGEVLIGANIYDKVSWAGTTSNAYGFYSITLPGREYRITMSLMGYNPLTQEIQLDADKILNISLEESGIQIKEVEIRAEQEVSGLKYGTSGDFRLSTAALKRMPGFAGNIDVVKSLQALPGFNAFGDGSTFYYVRGGNSDQNLMLIDEAPIFNPAHLFGFFSALAPDAIKDVKAYKGDFPASYGGRLSSVIDVRARDGNLNRVGFSGNLGVFTSDITLEGPLVKEKSSFILSARKSNLNWLSDRNVYDKSFTIDFYDLNAKLNLKINDKNRVFITGFTGRDDFSRMTNASVHTFGISWDNTTATIRWNHLFNNRVFANTTAIFSEYNYYLYVSREQDDYWRSSIRNRTLKSDLTWFANPLNTFRAGIEVNNHYSNPGNVHFSDNEIQRYAADVARYNSLGVNLYVSNDQEIGKRFSLKYGIRFSSWVDLGPTSVYFFDPNYKSIDTVQVASGNYYSPYFNAEPRLSLAYATTGTSTLKAGYCRTVQYLQMLSNSSSPFTSLEAWAPAGPNIKPQQADQFTLGYLKKLSNRGIYLSLETFYKLFHNQIEYEDHANMLFNPLMEGELRFGKARSYGIELLLRKSEGRVNGWLGYSYARAMKTINGINQNKEFPAFYDRPHSLFLSISANAGSHWDFSANWVYMTGAAITTPISFFDYNGTTVPVFGDKNNDRLPDYHRLDLAVTYRINKPESRYRHSIVLSVYNLYGRSNPFSVNFNKIMDDNGNFYIPSDLSGNYRIIPTTISVAGAIPSLNYTFRF